MDEQNNNPMNPYVTNETQDPYGTNGTQSPYGDPYGTNGSRNPYGTYNAQNPYGAAGAQDPYGMNNGQNPYGMNNAQNSYGAAGGQSPYGMNNGQNPYGAAGAQDPYGMNNGQSPYGMNNGQNPYGAAGAQNPYGMNNGQNPYGSIEPPKPPKKKMSKKTKAFLFGGIGLAVLAAAAIVLLLFVLLPAQNRKTVKQAIDNMLGSEGIFSNSMLVKELGVDELSRNFSSEGGELSAELQIGTGDAKDGYMTINADVAIDKSSKQMSGDLELGMLGTEIIDAEIFADEEQTYVTVEDFLNGYLAINNKNVISGLRNSWLLASLPDKAKALLNSFPDFSLDFFRTASSSFSLERLTSDDNKFWKESKIKSEGSEDLYAGSESISAKKYSVTIPKETLQEGISEALDTAMSALGSSGIGSVLGSSILSGASSINISQYATQIKALIGSMFKDDLVIYVYIKDDKLVAARASMDLNLVSYSINAELDFSSYTAGTQSVMNLSGGISLMGQKVELKVNAVTKEEGDSLKTNATIGVTSMGKEMVSGYYDQTYSKTSQDVEGSGSLSVNGSSLGSVSLKGKIAGLDKGKTVSLHVDDFSLTNSKGKVVAKASGDVTIKTKSAGINVKSRDSGKQVANLFSGSKEDAKKVLDESTEGYKKFMENFRKVFGSVPFEIEDF